LLSRYGTAAAGQPTFDAITIQLYESYAHADFNTSARVPAQTASEYLEGWVPLLAAGWEVEFSSAPEFGWPSQSVAVPPSQLVLGLANAWAGGDNPKSFLALPDELAKAWAALSAKNLTMRGGTFWSIPQEGQVPPGGSEPLFLAAGLNSFLHTRS